MDIMYDRQMSVTIAEFIGDMLKKEAEKVQQERGGDAGTGQGYQGGAPSRGQEGLGGTGSGDVSGESLGRMWGGAHARKGLGLDSAMTPSETGAGEISRLEHFMRL